MNGAPVNGAPVNGALALLRSLLASRVDTCFANPGTSEMHFVAALDGVPQMRAVLTLFEGVATEQLTPWPSSPAAVRVMRAAAGSSR